MTPKISVIVPVYNTKDYIHQCIDSILNQTYQNIEIILVNDGSPDNSGQICDEYLLIDERIVVIHQMNKGLSGARNSGLEVATGDFISFVDSDDWIEIEMYKTMIDLAITHELDIVECSINSTNSRPCNIDIATSIFQMESVYQALIRIIKTTQFSVCTKIFKKSILGSSIFVLNKTSEDVYYTIENIPKANKIGYYPFPFYNYRSNPDSITKSSYGLKRYKDSISAMLYLEQELIQKSSSKLTRQEEINSQKLMCVVRSFILKELMTHYKMLNYYSEIDPFYIHRKKLKQLIKKNYANTRIYDSYLMLANSLSIKAFEKLILLNKIRHKIFRTNQFYSF